MVKAFNNISFNVYRITHHSIYHFSKKKKRQYFKLAMKGISHTPPFFSRDRSHYEVHAGFDFTM